jgi:AcrR family transcriptional regulator
MSGKLAANKALKENALLNAAFDLCSRTDINSISIDEIVNRASVAKGTFYLYFKSKYDLLEGIVVKKASDLMSEALEATKSRAFTDRLDTLTFFSSYIIDRLSQDKLLTRIIYKNLTLTLYHKVLDDPVRGEKLKELVGDFCNTILGRGFSFGETDRLLFIVLEMMNSTCYSSIVNNEPAPIEEMKPILLKTIRKIAQ